MKGSSENFQKDTQGESRVAARESKVKLPSYQGQDDTVLWGGIIQEAGRLYKEYAAQGRTIPKNQVESLRARVKKLEHPESFRSNVGLSVWSGEIEKYGGMTTYETLFGDSFTGMLEQARTISDFSGYKLPPFRERRQTRLSYSQALLGAHRAFIKKAKSLRGAEMSQTEREVFEAAQEADREATKFLWKTRDVRIYEAMVEDSLGGEIKKETELRAVMTAQAEAEYPKTEDERSAQIAGLEAEKDHLWDEAKDQELIGAATPMLRGIISIVNRIKELKEMPLGGEQLPSAFGEDKEKMIDDLMDRVGEMTPEEFRAGVEELKRYTPGKDTASIVGVLMSKAKVEREEAGELPREQSIKRLYGEKRALILEEMAAAITRGDKRIDLDPERVRERYKTYQDYIDGKKTVPEDKREEIESAKRQLEMVEIDERVQEIKKKLGEERAAQKKRKNSDNGPAGGQ